MEKEETRLASPTRLAIAIMRERRGGWRVKEVRGFPKYDTLNAFADHIFRIISLPNSEHFSFLAPVISRAKS